MTNEEKRILNKYYFGEISKGQFLQQYPVNIINETHVYLSLKEAFDKKNEEELDLALTLITFGGDFIYSDNFVELLCQLLKVEWHHQHENIVTILQGIKSPRSIDTLYDTALIKFDYLKYDDSIPLGIKCIHALKEINTEYAREKLQLLAMSDIPIIKEKAKKQLNNYEG